MKGCYGVGNVFVLVIVLLLMLFLNNVIDK